MNAPLIDCCLHLDWDDQAELVAHLPAGWQEWVGRPNTLPGGWGSRPIGLHSLWPPPGLTSPPGDGRGRVARLTSALAWRGFDAGIVASGNTALLPAHPSPRVAAALTRAANDWILDRLAAEDGRRRLLATILVASQAPEEAVAEIHRLAGHQRIAGVSLGANATGKPYGHPLFFPIYEAAQAAGLPVVIHAGMDGIPDAIGQAVAGGNPASYVEYRLLACQPLLTHLLSLFTQGVFERFGELVVVFAGAGVAWAASVLWRVDANYRAMRREVPWMKRAPSEYFRRHVRLVTHPFDHSPKPGRLARYLSAFDGLEETLLFGSGLPGPEADDAEIVAARLPAGWADRALRTNPAATFPRAAAAWAAGTASP